MRVGNTYKTKSGDRVLLTGYYTLSKNFLGEISSNGGAYHSSLWNRYGENLEDPEWDLELKDANTIKESSSKNS